jgi:hypothetical protein
MPSREMSIGVAKGDSISLGQHDQVALTTYVKTEGDLAGSPILIQR